MGLLLGIDVGTTGTRAILVDEADGRVVAGATREYPLHTPKPLWAEQDPDDWWRGTVGAVQDALAAARKLGPLDVRGIGLSGQMHGVVLLGAGGKPLGRSLIWCDGRSQEQCDAITSRVGAARLIELTCNPALVGFSAPKMLWVREHDPAQWEKTKKFLLPKDYIRFRLTGEYASEVSDASGTLLFDVTKRTWSKEMLSALDLDASLLPSVHESPEVSARVRADVAAELGLPAGTPVVGGGGDQAAGAVGNGVVRAGLVSSTIGSSGVVFAHSDAPALDPGGRVHTFCHAVPGAWHVMGVTQGAGLSLRWFRDEVAGPLEREAAARAGRDVYDVLAERAAEAPAGCDGLFFLPYLMGERTPHLDAQARGVWFGLTASHTRAHLTRSVLEGVAYSLRDCLDLLVAMGVPVEEIRASGGGGKSPLWRQIQADVFGREVATVNAAEGPAYGAALLAGVGTAAWSTVPEACAATIGVTSRVAPDAARQAVYARGHGVYREVYSRLRTLYPAL
ncbi:MAG: xylulokinase [Vicinamibacteria bacterium]